MQADEYGHIITPGATATSAFGEPVSVPINPIIQLDALYGLDPREFQTFQFGSGSAESTGLTWKCHTGTSAYGYGVVRSNRIVRYRPGQGVVTRFTAGFQNPQADVTLRAGFFAQEQSLVIGYDGEDFGVLRQNGGKAQIMELTIATGGTGNATITLNSGTPVVVAIASTDTTVVAKTIAAASFPGYTVEQLGSTVRFLSNNIGLQSGTFSYSSTAGTGSFATLQNGAPNQLNWTYQENFNLDTLDGNGPSGAIIDFSKLNIYQINFRWLGAGIIRYAIENPLNGDMIFFHQEKYSNQYEVPHLDNPSFKIGYIAANLTANTITDAHVIGASMMAAIEGVDNDKAFTSSTAVSKAALAQNDVHNMLTLKNSLIYQNKINLRKVKILDISAAVNSTKPVLVHIVLNGTKASGHNFAKVANFSGVSQDTSDGTYTITNEHQIAEFVIPPGGSLNKELDKFEITIPPNNTLNIAVSSIAQIQETVIAVTWIEL